MAGGKGAAKGRCAAQRRSVGVPRSRRPPRLAGRPPARSVLPPPRTPPSPERSAMGDRLAAAGGGVVGWWGSRPTAAASTTAGRAWVQSGRPPPPPTRSAAVQLRAGCKPPPLCSPSLMSWAGGCGRLAKPCMAEAGWTAVFVGGGRSGLGGLSLVAWPTDVPVLAEPGVGGVRLPVWPPGGAFRAPTAPRGSRRGGRSAPPHPGPARHSGNRGACWQATRTK